MGQSSHANKITKLCSFVQENIASLLHK